MEKIIVTYISVTVLLLAVHFFLEMPRATVNNRWIQQLHLLLDTNAVIGMSKEKLARMLPMGSKELENGVWVYRYIHYHTPWVVQEHTLEVLFKENQVTSFKSTAATSYL